MEKLLATTSQMCKAGCNMYALIFVMLDELGDITFEENIDVEKDDVNVDETLNIDEIKVLFNWECFSVEFIIRVGINEDFIDDETI